ncbi:hypothetical protein SBV1_gp24 [Sulfolobales Beppu virus 1]|nr:hypothetical protein SBV1_gp24 [Sulfolobales Beppu virus 1]
MNLDTLDLIKEILSQKEGKPEILFLGSSFEGFQIKEFDSFEELFEKGIDYDINSESVLVFWDGKEIKYILTISLTNAMYFLQLMMAFANKYMKGNQPQ